MIVEPLYNVLPALWHWIRLRAKGTAPAGSLRAFLEANGADYRLACLTEDFLAQRFQQAQLETSHACTELAIDQLWQTIRRGQPTKPATEE